MSRRSHLGLALWATFAALGCGDIEAPSPEGPPPLPTRIAPALGSTLGGQLVAIEGTGFSESTVVLFDGVPATNVHATSSGVVTATTPPHAEGVVTIRIYDRVGRSSDLLDAYTYVRSFDQEGRPRLVNAVSLDNTRVRVVFSEPVTDGAEEITSYSITQQNVNPESASLVVLAAQRSADGTSVDLTTSSQNEVIYQLAAANIRDLDGNLLAPPELLVNPSVVDFAGKPPSAGSTLVDTDGDGLFDNVELGGWSVTVFLTNGDVSTNTHTSDPYVADTDGDGLGDAEELHAGSNPRDTDTDGDTVPDADEWNDWWSDPTKQDTDEDGLSDALDLLFDCSPILDDTDGDGYEDYEELFELNRNPLLADLPRPQIVISSFDLSLDVRNSYTDEAGTVHSSDSSSSVSVSQSTATSLGRSDTRTTEAANQSSQSFGTELSFGGKDGFGGKVSANVGFEQSRAQGFSSTVDAQTATEMQRSYDESVGESFEQSENRSVTRTVEAARIVATVNVANASDVPFTLENVEISVMRQDRRQQGAFRPVATLRPAGGGDLSLNLGPLDTERGPIVFENTDIFPNLADELMREPTGLVFKVANFDVTDEEGRNFAYSSATVNSRTAGITIDAGDGRTRTYRVATHARFDANGRATGISIQRGLELIGFAMLQNDAELPSSLPTPAPAGIRLSVGTRVDSTGVERLVRIGTVQNDVAQTHANKRFWTVQTNNETLDADVSFSQIQLRAGHDYLLSFVSDLDEDGLFDREEETYGSSDSSTDSDGDGIGDFEEVRTGWMVRVVPGIPYRAFPSPGRPDSDTDGLTDDVERTLGTDPNRADTDDDGLLDGVESSGQFGIVLFDGDADPSNNETLAVVPYVDGLTPSGSVELGISPGPDGICNSTAATGDVQTVPVGSSVSPVDTCVTSGSDGNLQTAPTGDDFARAPHLTLVSLDPLRQDTDVDGIADGREVILGTNPNTRDAGNVVDTDRDGLFDAEEERGWDVSYPGTPSFHVVSSKTMPDSDLDGVPDVFEFAILSNPRSRDTEGDGLPDGREFDVTNVDSHYDALRLGQAASRCASSSTCQAPAVVSIANRTRSSVVSVDTDGDGRHDYAEVNEPWQVVVTNGGTTNAPITVFSPANRADADGDGLDDSAELARGTHPTNADTDGDGTLDGTEVATSAGGLTRDPRNVDRLIVLRIPSYVSVIGDCDTDDVATTQGSLSFQGALHATLPSGAHVQTFDYVTCNDYRQPASHVPGPSFAYDSAVYFLLHPGEAFGYDSDTIVERDNLPTEDDTFSPTAVVPTEAVQYESIAGSTSWSRGPIRTGYVQNPADSDPWCRIDVTLSAEIR